MLGFMESSGNHFMRVTIYVMNPLESNKHSTNTLHGAYAHIELHSLSINYHLSILVEFGSPIHCKNYVIGVGTGGMCPPKFS